MDVWLDVDSAWRYAFELAWDAYRARTIPVGVVITDARGDVVARGRNRIFETNGPKDEIFGSRVAHAEINALVQLETERQYFDCTLWTTLEPCPQCIGAAWISTLGRVSFAALDIYGGASKLIERHIEAADSARSFPMPVEGPVDGVLAVFGELLHVAYFLESNSHHHVTEAYRARRPALVALAERVRLRERAEATVDEVLAHIEEVVR